MVAILSAVTEIPEVEEEREIGLSNTTEISHEFTNIQIAKLLTIIVEDQSCVDAGQFVVGCHFT